MKKVGLKLIASTLLSVLVFASFLGIKSNNSKKYKPGDYIVSENAYYAGEIDSEVGLTKAEPYFAPSDTYYSAQKARSHSTSMIGDIESVWDSYTGKGTKIAIIDDGFDYNHPEYVRSDGSSAILPESRYYFVSGSKVDYQEYSETPSCLAENWAKDSSGTYRWDTHGTNTSTTAAAPINSVGGVGIAPEADILALKIDMQFVSISYAIKYAVEQKVDVINMSLGAYADSFTDVDGNYHAGSSGLTTYLDNSLQYAYNNGVIVVAAAGNHATTYKSYPACNYKVIGVGALGKNTPTTFAQFTNYVGSSQTGEVNVDILAPGFVYTAGLSGDQGSPSHTYFETQGTSFSSPIVAAAACLWKEKYPSGTPDQFLSELQSTASDIGAYTNINIRTNVGPSNITNGRLNVANLLNIDEPYVSTAQSNIALQVGGTKQIDLIASNGTITYSSNTPSVATVSNSGLVRAVGTGNATITVTATKNGDTATATISVTVSSDIVATSMEFVPSSISLEIGGTYNAEETIVTDPVNASRDFMFESLATNVFTVDELTGVITAVGAGSGRLYCISSECDAYLDVTVTAPQTPTSWDKVTTISEGDYLIVYEAGSKAFNGGLSSLDVANNTIGVTISNGRIAYSAATEAAKFTISALTNGYSIKSASGYYIGCSTNSNTITTSTTSELVNTIAISSGDATITGTSGKKLLFNTAADQQRFRYMSSGGSIQLYKATTGGAPLPTVSGVTVSPNTLSLDVYTNPNGYLAATVNGDNNPSQEVTWLSSDASIATVVEGEVTAISKGTATITATSVADNTKSGSCTVTVADSTPVTLSSISVKTAPTKTSYEVDDYFDPTGLVITRHYSDNSESDYTYANHTSEFSFDPDLSTALTTSDTSVTITYGGISTTQSITVTSSGGGGGGTSSRTYTIGWGTASGTAGTYSNFTTTSGSVTNILSFSSQKNSGTNDPAYNSSNNELRLYYHSGGKGNSITITPASDVTFTSFSMTTSTSPSVKYSVDGGTATSASRSDYTYTPASDFEATSSLLIQNVNTTNTQLRILTITITYETVDESDKVIGSLSASYSGGNIYVGDNLDTSKVSVTANFTDSTKYSSETLSSSDYSLSTLDSSSAGIKSITVTYTGSLATLTTPLTTSFNVTVVADTVTNVTVSNTKTYHPGETIVKSDITVTLSWASGKADTTTTDFSFANDGYQFTYSDAPSGGTSASKQFSITYDNNSYNFSVSVSRVAYQAVAGTTDTLNRATTGVTSGSTTYTSWSGKTGTSGSVYAGQSAGNYDSIQLRSDNSNSGIIMTSSGGKVAKVTIVWQSNTSNGRTVNIYGKNSAYSAPTDLYNSSNQGTLLGTIAKGTSTELTISGDYEYIGIRSASGAMYITSISIQFAGGTDNPTNVSNYIMYEDTNGQCITKLSQALTKLNSMSDDDKNTFMTSNDYVISTARERIEAWARHEGKTFSLTNNTFVVNSASISPITNNVTNNPTLTIVVIFTTMSLISIGGYFFIRRKHE